MLETVRVERRRARVIAQAARLRGDLPRQLCDVCGVAKVDAHHDRYDQPLAVRWLCKRHHGDAHVILRVMSDAPQTPLRQLRLAAGLTLSEVARRSGINKGRLSIIERGVPPTDAEAARILAALRQLDPEPVG